MLIDRHAMTYWCARCLIYRIYGPTIERLPYLVGLSWISRVKKHWRPWLSCWKGLRYYNVAVVIDNILIVIRSSRPLQRSCYRGITGRLKSTICRIIHRLVLRHRYYFYNWGRDPITIIIVTSIGNDLSFGCRGYIMASTL